MRGKKSPKRKIQEDYKFGSPLVAKFINQLMKGGKKSVAQKVLYSAMEQISAKTKQDPLDVLDKALKNISPQLEVKSRRIGGAHYQIPIEVRGERRTTLAMRWLIGAAKSRQGKPMGEKLALELIDASNKLGEAHKKMEDVQRMAEANRAFAHFA
ncbi:MAG: 30S ribosomal protein S7 [Patescibacteria group bacterium]